MDYKISTMTQDSSCLDDFPQSLQNSIRNVIKNEGYTSYIVKKKLLPSEGNFLGLLYLVDINGETNDGVKETSLFVKKSVTLEKIAIASVAEVFSRELFIYNDLSKVFAKVQEEAKVPAKERFRILKTYESTVEAIVMENLGKEGFKTYNRKEVVPIKFAELSIVELAKFHALSFVIKEKEPEYFHDKIRTLKIPFSLDNDWRRMIENMCATSASVLEGEAKSKIAEYAPRFCYLFKKYMQDTSNVSPHGCICHGDYKFLNILVKEVDGKATEVCPIDYQLIYFGNPVDDLLFFLFTCTDQKFRRQHLKYLKELYFENFAKFLQYFDLEVDEIYPREAFEKDYSERFELGLVFGLYLAIFTFAHFDEGFDVNKLSLAELPIIPDDLFTDRVRGLVDDYIEWGYL